MTETISSLNSCISADAFLTPAVPTVSANILLYITFLVDLDTSHRIALYKADNPMSNDYLTLIAVSREFHNPGWTSMHEETLYMTSDVNRLEPGATYYVVYALKGFTPIHVAGSAIVQGPSVPLVAWQLTTLESIPEHLEYGLWLTDKVPFVSIRANA